MENDIENVTINEEKYEIIVEYREGYSTKIIAPGETILEKEKNFKKILFLIKFKLEEQIMKDVELIDDDILKEEIAEENVNKIKKHQIILICVMIAMALGLDSSLVIFSIIVASMARVTDLTIKNKQQMDMVDIDREKFNEQKTKMDSQDYDLERSLLKNIGNMESCDLKQYLKKMDEQNITIDDPIEDLIDNLGSFIEIYDIEDKSNYGIKEKIKRKIFKR